VEALSDSRAVAILGARQVGKSTLVAQIASEEHPARLISLDDEATAAAAQADPTGFIADIDAARAARRITDRPRTELRRRILPSRLITSVAAPLAPTSRPLG
jgi:predicted ABC-type ATPase